MKELTKEEFRQRLRELFPKKHGKRLKKGLKKARRRSPKRKWNTYSEYLKTKHWKNTRKRILEKFNYQCFDCVVHARLCGTAQSSKERQYQPATYV